MRKIFSRYYHLRFYGETIPLMKVIVTRIKHPFIKRFGSGRGGEILAIDWSITNRCNLRCAMCHSFGYPKDVTDEMPFEEIRKFIEENKGYFSAILLTGGEPFLREDICDIVDVIKANGLSCGICTNGTVLDHKKMYRLKKSGLDFIIFSIHGSREVHDDIVGRKGSFDIAINNLREFLQLNSAMKVVINCAISEKNFDKLGAVAQIAKQFNIPLRYEHLNYISHRNRVSHLEEWRKRMKGVSDCEVMTYNFDPRVKINISVIQKSIEDITRDSSKIFFKPSLNYNNLKKWYSEDCGIERSCYFVWHALHLTPRGDVIPCHFLNLKMGNINESKLLEIWNSDQYRAFRKELRKGIFIGCYHCNKL